MTTSPDPRDPRPTDPRTARDPGRRDEGFDDAYCPRFQAAVELIGRRWTASILRALFADIERYSDIARAVPGLSHRLLSERLRELEEAGIVTSPRRGVYRLTAMGRDLLPALQAIDEWNETWGDAVVAATDDGQGSGLENQSS